MKQTKNNIEKNIIYADLGNTRTKFLLSDGSFVTINNNELLCDISTVSSLVNSIFVYATVNPETEQFLLQNIKFEKAIKAIELLKQSQIVNLSLVQSMGEDRIMGLLGGLSVSAPPIITIDCGTAITINVMDKSRIIRGGVIMPGIKLQELSLRNYTKGLRDFSFTTTPKQVVGNNTSDAISSGIIYGIVGAIESVVQKIINDFFSDEEVRIFLLGGNSNFLKKHLLKLGYVHDANLVLKGVKHLYENI